MLEISVDEIKSYSIKRNLDYSKGGFYMIKNINSNKAYIGKSKNYMQRLKQHLYKSSKKSLIDIDLKSDIVNFKFFLIFTYSELNINFFNKKNEIIFEHRLITKYKSNYPFGYNISHYGHL